ncbi:hypothetical protein KC316_g39 [Hortaea werneckii]|nr:hypothetical protein KC316_g39 [Hortaea werneckii]
MDRSWVKRARLTIVMKARTRYIQEMIRPLQMRQIVQHNLHNLNNKHRMLLLEKFRELLFDWRSAGSVVFGTRAGLGEALRACRGDSVFALSKGLFMASTAAASCGIRASPTSLMFVAPSRLVAAQVRREDFEASLGTAGPLVDSDLRSIFWYLLVYEGPMVEMWLVDCLGCREMAQLAGSKRARCPPSQLRAVRSEPPNHPCLSRISKVGNLAIVVLGQ